MKLNRTSRQRLDADTERFLREVAQQVNALSEGTLAANYNALPAIPTRTEYADGDEIRNSAPSELGAPGSKYVLRGWMFLGGAWVEQRFFTGN